LTRHDHPDQRRVRAGPLTAGPRWYRTRIRTLGPLAGTLPMGLLGAVSIVALRVGDGRTSGLIGLLGGVAAAPGLLVVGAPFADDSNYPAAVLASGVMWMLLGLLASRRATRSPMASWRDYWREMTWLTLAVVMGAMGALVAAATMLSESLVL
jgi:hypothetical protein